VGGRHRLGVALLVTFLVCTSLRDIGLSAVFASYGFFEVAMAAFGTATVCFLALVLAFAPVQLRTLRLAWRQVLLVNLTTAIAWLSYFGSLRFVEPSVTNTVYSGIAPLAVMSFAAWGFKARSEERVGSAERAAHLALAGTLGVLGWTVLSGHSGIADLSLHDGAFGLALAAASGISITAETIVAKRMNEAGVFPAAVLGVRFVFVTLIAACCVGLQGGSFWHTAPAELGYLAIAALLLIAAPIYLVQAGLAYTSPMTTSVVLSLGPAFVLAAQVLAGNIVTSPYVLSVVALYCAVALLGNLAFARRRTSGQLERGEPSVLAQSSGIAN
jgi:drug/metabolite transporter (DMT)-like permease